MSHPRWPPRREPPLGEDPPAPAPEHQGGSNGDAAEQRAPVFHQPPPSKSSSRLSLPKLGRGRKREKAPSARYTCAVTGIEAPSDSEWEQYGGGACRAWFHYVLLAASEFTLVARRLGCFRGISTLTGFALAVEIGDWTRFSRSSIGAFVGLTPSEHSSGSSRSQGSITKTGNSHARRLLVEAAWHHQRAYRPGKTMQDRWALAPIAAQVRGDAGNRRLHRQWLRFTARKKRPTIAVVAIARELAGWCWSLATLDLDEPSIG